ncbi:unknown [Firmicutes bacterium CAG:145]|nr:unknown [Firmicutes bacterium CAG:145]
MYIYALCALRSRKTYDGLYVIYVAVNASVGKQPHDMKRFAASGMIYSGKQSRIAVKDAIVYSLAYASQFLINYSACADIQMPDLGVTHLSFGKTYCKAAGL